MSGGEDWNAVFARRKAARDAERAQSLALARAAAPPEKEPFDPRTFRRLYARLNPDDVDRNTPWETLIRESEYDYYVARPELMTLKALVEHLKWAQGWG